jgi:hypothetical protein
MRKKWVPVLHNARQQKNERRIDGIPAGAGITNVAFAPHR